MTAWSQYCIINITMSEFIDDHSHTPDELDRELVQLLFEAEEVRSLMNTDDNEFEPYKPSDREIYYRNIRMFAAEQIESKLARAVARKHGYREDLEATVARAFMFG